MTTKPVYGCYYQHGDGALTEPLIGYANDLKEAADMVRAKYHGVRYVQDYDDQFITAFKSSRDAFPEIKVEG
jgi:hypothetical protein